MTQAWAKGSGGSGGSRQGGGKRAAGARSAKPKAPAPDALHGLNASERGQVRQMLALVKAGKKSRLMIEHGLHHQKVMMQSKVFSKAERREFRKGLLAYEYVLKHGKFRR
jgi:hypothetical protein